MLQITPGGRLATPRRSRRSRYSATSPGRLWRPWPARLAPLAAALLIALTAGGCSISYKLESLLSKDKDAPDHAGSLVTPGSGATAGRLGSEPHETDLALAKAAAAEALARGGEDISVPWQNPRTGARGNVTPIASAYTQDGFVCRDFLASYVHERSESWLQGEACRIHQGRWEVRAMKPLQRP